MNSPHGARAIWLVGRTVLLELLRRKDVYVLLALTGVFSLTVLAVREIGMEDPAVATFLLNLGLTAAVWVSHALTLLLAARQMPMEFELRTVYPLLARPVRRLWVLLGKWGACTLSGTLVFTLLAVMVYWPVPKLEPCNAAMLRQALALQPVSLALMAALAICLSLFLPRGVVLLAGCALFLGAGPVTSRAGAHSWFSHYLPDFSRLNMVTRYTDGLGPLPPAEFAGLLLYAGIFACFCLALSSRLLERKPL